MTTSEYLQPNELQDLTGYARATGQARWLKLHGIPHQVRGRRVIVSREHVRAWLEGRQVVTSAGPNWAAVT